MSPRLLRLLTAIPGSKERDGTDALKASLAVGSRGWIKRDRIMYPPASSGRWVS